MDESLGKSSLCRSLLLCDTFDFVASEYNVTFGLEVMDGAGLGANGYLWAHLGELCVWRKNIEYFPVPAAAEKQDYVKL